MRKQKRDDPATGEPNAVEDAEAAARAAARSIAERFETQWPEPERLGEDPEFVRASTRLAAPDVSLETVERLGRASKPILAAIAHRATALRGEVSGDWLDWAYRRMKGAYAGELAFLLEAVERHGQP